MDMGMGTEIADTVSYLASPTAVCFDYGMVEITWSAVTGTWSELQLVRNTNGEPISVNDGATIFTSMDPMVMSYIDTGASPGKRAYYGLFLMADDGTWMPAGTTETVVITNHGYTDQLWDRLPNIYKLDSFANLTGTPNPSNLLYRFLSVFGFSLDEFRTEFDELLRLDAADVPESVLPALLAQLGFSAEPELNARARRQLAANAVELYEDKGTVDTLENLTNILTDWDASVSLSPNMVLDNLDALTDLSYGRWATSKSMCTLEVRNNTVAVSGPYGRGYTAVIPTSPTQAFSLSTSMAGRYGRLHSIPIIQGRTYVASVYMSGGNAALVNIDWYGIGGEYLSTAAGAAVTLVSGWTRVYTTGIAPPGARYAAMTVSTPAASPTLLLNAAQFEEVDPVPAADPTVAPGTSLAAWYATATAPTPGLPSSYMPARQALIALIAELINEVYNPNGVGGTQNWTGATAGLTAGTDGLLLHWSNGDQVSAGDRRRVHASPLVSVEPGDIITLLASMRAASIAEDGVPFDAAFGVELDVGWHIRQFSNGVETFAYHYEDSDFIRLTAAVNLGTVGTAPWQDVAFTYTVPAGITEIEAAVAITRQRMNTIGPLLYVRSPAPGTGLFSGAGSLTVIPTGGAIPPPLPTSSAMDAVRFRHVALIKGRAADVFYFDGDSGSTAEEYVWEGTPNASRSHYYSHRGVKVQRLLELAEDFLPHPQGHWLDASEGESMAFTTALPQQLVYTPRWALINYAIFPAPSPMVVVGNQVEIDWARAGQTWATLDAPPATWATVIAAYPDWNSVRGA